MTKRKVIFGAYDTASSGGWTLNAWSLSPAEYQSDRITVPGRDGSLDLTAALTGGEPRYNDRTLTVRLESSEGTRLEREETINSMINQLSGRKMNIVLPDDSTRYIVGRLQVAKEYNDLAHAAVNVTAICAPYKYKLSQTVAEYDVTGSLEITLQNDRKPVVPTVTTDAEITVEFGESTIVFPAGTRRAPALILTEGSNAMTLTGTGHIKFEYQEGAL
jgi:phage-related protein